MQRSLYRSQLLSRTTRRLYDCYKSLMGMSFLRHYERNIFSERKPGGIKCDTWNIQQLRSVWIAESLNDHPGDSRLSCSPSPLSPVSLPSLAFFHLRRAAPLLGPFAALLSFLPPPPTLAFGPNNLPSRRRAHSHTRSSRLSSRTERDLSVGRVLSGVHTRATPRRPQTRAGDKAWIGDHRRTRHRRP